MADELRQGTINTYGDKNVLQGMLSSPHIAYCIKKYGIIKDAIPKNIKSATYDMRIGGSVLTWYKGEKIEFELGEEEDKNKNIFTKVDLKPNSLTFVTTIEKFNLPKDIIARFNLKSKWVHEGLLLGTGPIVDPELKANLLIPLHNFSSQTVTLNHGDSLISVEFTKTLNPDDKPTFSSEEFHYVQNENSVFDFHGYRKRIAGKTVESSVLATLFKFEEMIDVYKKRLAILSWGGGIAGLTVMVTLVALIFTTWSLIKNASDTYNDASSLVKQYQSQNIDFKAFALKNVSDKNIEEINELKIKMSELTNRLNNSNPYLQQMELSKILQRIDELEREQKSFEHALKGNGDE